MAETIPDINPASMIIPGKMHDGFINKQHAGKTKQHSKQNFFAMIFSKKKKRKDGNEQSRR